MKHIITHITKERKIGNLISGKFLMLFLAVFCGFLAEYKLEHIIEKKGKKNLLQVSIMNLRGFISHPNRNWKQAKKRCCF
jgi:hypothetical protein